MQKDKDVLEAKFITIEKPERIVLEYSITGKGEPILFLHGGGTDHYHYTEFLLGLGENYKVYAFTMPGFARSSGIKDFTLENLLEVTYEFVKALELNKFIIMGQSFGAGMALAFAGKYPQMIKKVFAFTPLASSINKNFLKLRTDIKQSSAERREKIGKVREEKKNFSWSDLFVVNFRETFITLKLVRLVNNFHLDNYLANIKSPVYAYIGKRDIVVDPDQQKRDMKKIEKVKVKLFPEDGHYLLFSQMGAILKDINETIK